jgi:prepilin-type N-terminal cleavage/methylation domain-containing protein
MFRQVESRGSGVGGGAIFGSRPSVPGLQPAFTLIELLVVLAVLGILAALLLPALSAAKKRAWTAQCQSNLHQIGIGMKLFADDNNELYPESGGTIRWDQKDAATGNYSWMQQIVSYAQNTNVYHCPADDPSQVGFFNYFNGVRAAYVDANGFAAVDGRRIQFPEAYVLSGDTIGSTFTVDNADKDDYTYNCVGGDANGTPSEEWQVHSKGQNLLFEEGHVKFYKGYNTNEMTFRYDSMHNWE